MSRHVSTRSRWRPALASLLVFAVTISVLVLLAEALVRGLRLQSDLFTQPHPQIGWVHRPNVRGTYVSTVVKSPVVTNAQGLMGPIDYSQQKTAGMRRMLLLGDSFTESEQVPFEQSWPALLDERLGKSWEVLNAGVAGYGTDNALLYLKAEGVQFEPDAVFLLFFTGNDVSDNDRSLGQQIGSWQPQPYFEIENGTLRLRDYPLDLSHIQSWPARAKLWVRRHSNLYLLVHERIYRARALQRQTAGEGPRIPKTWHVYKKELDPDWQRAWLVTEAILLDLQRECASRGADFFLGIMPTGWRIDPVERERLLDRYPSMADTSKWQFDLPDLRLKQLGERAGFPVLDLSPALRAATRAGGESLFLDHLSPRGHVVAAEAIIDFLYERGLEPE